MSHNLRNLGLEYRIPTWVRSAIADRLEHDITLSRLPENSKWQFMTDDTAVLTKENKPINVNVYGAVRQAQLHGIAAGEKAWLQVRLWSREDGEVAERMFEDCEQGDPCIRATVLFQQKRILEKKGELKRGYLCAVLDGTNPAYGREQPILNPGTVKEGDLVRLRCYLVLHATVATAPTYSLHLETVIVAALSPDDLPPVDDDGADE